MTASNRTFGIELELFLPRGKTHADLARFVTGKGVDCNAENYGHSVPTSWKVVTDGSLGDYSRGAEVVSPVLAGQDGLNRARIVCDALKEFGCSVNVKCGFHVHIGAGDFGPEELKKLSINFIWFEDFFDHIMPASRRACANQYVSSNRHRFGGYGTAAVNAAFNQINNVTHRAAYYDRSPSTEAIDVNDVIRVVCGNTRYLKLNLTSLSRQPTVEFRQHSGTVDADKVVNWVSLLVAFVEKSKVSRPRPRSIERDLKPVEEMNRFFAYIPCEPDVKTFYMARRKELAGEARAAERQNAADLANGETVARDLIARLTARRERVLSYARPQRRLAFRIENAIRDLDYALQGRHSTSSVPQAQAIANSIARVRASNLIPA